MKYYTLCIKRDGLWEPEFGDYDKDVVKNEKQEYGFSEYPTKIVSSGDSQESINQAIDKLNNG